MPVSGFCPKNLHRGAAKALKDLLVAIQMVDDLALRLFQHRNTVIIHPGVRFDTKVISGWQPPTLPFRR
jgi:hypothetical protein